MLIVEITGNCNTFYRVLEWGGVCKIVACTRQVIPKRKTLLCNLGPVHMVSLGEVSRQVRKNMSRFHMEDVISLPR